ncbi:MAG: hypothetical protein LBB81_06500 [Treponema sp.]|jgi:hypothetical protein|nr:hypothetical protein [Treponema sp.]
MKKIITVMFFILSVFRVYAQSSVIEQVSGTVEIKQPGESSFKSANSGDEIFQDTVISTSLNAAILQFKYGI